MTNKTATLIPKVAVSADLLQRINAGFHGQARICPGHRRHCLHTGLPARESAISVVDVLVGIPFETAETTIPCGVIDLIDREECVSVELIGAIGTATATSAVQDHHFDAFLHQIRDVSREIRVCFQLRCFFVPQFEWNASGDG